MAPFFCQKMCEFSNFGTCKTGLRSAISARYQKCCSAIAQLVEQLTVNQLVAGSSPACGAILFPRNLTKSLFLLII